MTRLVVAWLASPRARQIPDGSGRLRLDALEASMRSVHAVLRPLLPSVERASYVVFHEDLDAADRDRFRQILPVNFYEVDFSGFDEEFAQAKTFRHKGY